MVITSAVRTPVGKFMGGLSTGSSPELGALAIKEALARSGVPIDAVDEVIMGNVVSAGLGQNPARQAAIYAGIPVEVPAYTVNKVCGSGLKSVVLAAQAIKAGDAGIVVAGGMENMSMAPYILRNARTGYRLGDGKIVDAMVYDGLWDKYNDFHMGMTGEIIADKFGVEREDIDRWALRSHQRAAEAWDKGEFDEETFKIPVKVGKKELVVERDEGIRTDTTLEKLSKLRPVFKEGGKITAGNASQISDGASAAVVMPREEAERRGVDIMATIRAYTSSGVAPELVMYAPVPAIRHLWKKENLSDDDIEAYEINEAFASQSVALVRELGIDPEKVNVRGGAVAIGHPIGASGTRCLTTLLHVMKHRKLHRGLVTLCLGGGNAVAMIVEMEG